MTLADVDVGCTVCLGTCSSNAVSPLGPLDLHFLASFLWGGVDGPVELPSGGATVTVPLHAVAFWARLRVAEGASVAAHDACRIALRRAFNCPGNYPRLRAAGYSPGLDSLSPDASAYTAFARRCRKDPQLVQGLLSLSSPTGTARFFPRLGVLDPGHSACGAHPLLPARGGRSPTGEVAGSSGGGDGSSSGGGGGGDGGSSGGGGGGGGGGGASGGGGGGVVVGGGGAPAGGVVGHHPHTPTSSNWVPLVLSPPCGCHCPPSRCQHVATLGVTFFFGPLISRV
jgi:hypothetical protein